MSLVGIVSKWLKQAEADLEAAIDSLKTRHFEWACFQAQQAAEKALKAFLFSRGYTSILSHSLKFLTKEASQLEPEFEKYIKEAKKLDMYYIPTRYPNGLGGEITPAEFYDEEDAQQCINSAKLILEIVKKYINK